MSLPYVGLAYYGGAERVRTDDPLLAKQVLYQLSYDPIWRSTYTFVYKERIFEIYFVRSIRTQAFAFRPWEEPKFFLTP